MRSCAPCAAAPLSTWQCLVDSSQVCTYGPVHDGRVDFHLHEGAVPCSFRCGQQLNYGHVPPKTFQPTTGRTYDGGAQFPICGSGGIFFVLGWEQYLWGLAVESLYSQHLSLRTQVTFHSFSQQPVSAQRSLSPQHYRFRGCNSAPTPRSSLMVFRAHCCKSFVEDLRSWTKAQVHRTHLNMT